MSQEIIDILGNTEAKKQWLTRRPIAYSAIYGPKAEILAELLDEEGIIYADIDIEDEIDQKQIIDIIGHTNRLDVLSLNLTTDEDKALIFHTHESETVNIQRLLSKFTDEFQIVQQQTLEELKHTSDLLRQLVKKTTKKKIS